MAKSLRSSKQQHNKIVKRQGVFGAVAADRERKVAERLHHAAIGQILANQEQPAKATTEDSMDVESKSEPAEVPAAPSKKSTGGWGRKRKTRGKKSKKSRK